VDDALHARALANGGFEIGVHIADVSHFVRQARRRARRPARRSSAAVLGRLALLQELAFMHNAGKRGCSALKVTTSHTWQRCASDLCKVSQSRQHVMHTPLCL